MNSQIKVVIVDDTGADTLFAIIRRYFSDLKVIGIAKNVNEAIILIEKAQPELVFLDIKLPDGNGFDVLSHFPEKKFEVIFTTAYENYALEAFKSNALHYLVKPINIKDLEVAIKRFYKAENEHQSVESTFKESSNDVSLTNMKINIPIYEGFSMVECNNIVKVISYGSSSKVFTMDGNRILSNKLLKYFDENLPQEVFFRINKSVIINLNHLVSYLKGRGGEVYLSDGSVEAVATRRKIDFLAKISGKGKIKNEDFQL